MHLEKHPLAGRKVQIGLLTVPQPHVPKGVNVSGGECVVEDWFDRVTGETWSEGAAKGSHACMRYALRSLQDGLPTDDDVVWVKINNEGYIVHESELGTPIQE